MKKYLQIFLRFFRVGALTFGGGLSMLPIIDRELAQGDDPKLSSEQITDNYAVAQCLPGIIAVNTSIISGYQIAGTLGGLVAAFGVCLPSLIIILILAAALRPFMDVPAVVHALMGIRCGVCALILNTIRRLFKGSIVDWFTMILMVVSFFLLTFLDISPVIPIIIGAALGIVSKKAGVVK